MTHQLLSPNIPSKSLMSTTRMDRESLLQSVCESAASIVAEPFLTPVTVADVPLPAMVRLPGWRLFQVMVRPLGVIVACTCLLLPTQTNGGALVILTFTVSPLQTPLLHLSLTVHLSLSSQLEPFWPGSGLQQSSTHFLHFSH